MKKCSICKEKFEPRFSSLQKTCEKPECVLANHKASKEKAWAKEKKERKENLMTHGDWENMLQVEMNKIARLIDKDHPCMSCQGRTLKPQGGHLRSVGSASNIRFHLENIWLQCYSCNEEKSGNVNGYDDGLIKTFGKEYHEHVKFEIMRTNQSIKLSIPELKEAITEARKIVRELEKTGLVYPNEMRIALRKSYNKRLGIYQS